MEKIWGSQLLKKHLYTVNENYVGSINNIKIKKIKLVEDM